ncbi:MULTISPECIES: cytochrome c [Pseudomonas]|jgi:mono/diheme cytochrome c family protein|uniref:Cytochrome c family protein n=1 Tax=Pseudomonas putida (strain ATCC 47054 / DSM 6125 / CFBP 8728 / NCIMB 11950 / KT2440) TaxID=160488 RepID=Q88LT6_PSEPK|nr:MULTISPECIES: cytochrome c [Pseudomonas]AAN67460.1 Cytochrome c family protein [Pseudomonas putida KT2440]KMU95908.1 cytochrome C [Pseudomonas putida]KMY36049.1 cytochrome C [Pseudomonas putida]MBP2843540.1 cytochrome c [Pseudomonas sp. PNP]MDD2082796.1 cytochrome c [Pseudomonas putida]
MRHCLALLALLLSLPLSAAQLHLELGATTRQWSSAELLGHPEAQDISIEQDVSYKRPMHYRAVPLATLLEGVSARDHLQAVALDGFAAEMPAAALLQPGPARAWLAVEDPGKPWPPLGQGKPSAGPFYLVWTAPQASGIRPEQWPFQIATLRKLAPVDQRFPALLPDPKLPADSPVRQGFALFQQNCLVCHRLNGAGDGQVGPDLNVPYNPTEYFQPVYLRKLIRDPQSLRRWPQAKMPGFAESVLSEQELDALLAYLGHMATRKP